MSKNKAAEEVIELLNRADISTNWGGKRIGAGRKRSHKKRCPCGAMTAKRAQARGHHC